MKAELIQDLEQQKIILKEINSVLRIRNQELQNNNAFIVKLIEQKLLFQLQTEPKIGQSQVINTSRRKYVSILGILIIFPLLFVSAFLGNDLNSNLVINDDKRVMTGGYVVQNLKGDTIGLFHSWDIPKERTLYVNIVNPNVIDPDKIQIIKDVILSEKTVSLDNSIFHKGLPGTSSTYFLGWNGALKQASQTPTKFTIPTSFSISESSTNGDISIILSTLESPDGYSGFTKSTVENNQIFKSVITIYNANQLSSADLETITRHEFGHAVGLIHSSDPTDLMHPTIETNYPLISDCDISAITHLYDGNVDKVICEI